MEGQPDPEIDIPKLRREVWDAFSDAFEAVEVSEDDLEAMDVDEMLGAVYTAGLMVGLDESDIEERLFAAGITEEPEAEE